MKTCLHDRPGVNQLTGGSLNPECPEPTHGSRDALTQLETMLAAAVASDRAFPQALHRSMRHAVFSGGKRLRPRLLLSVAEACGANAAAKDFAFTAACAVELVHCASLVHDDLPAFDDAELRRGVPTVHAAFGEATAILCGDALLTLAFEVLATATSGSAEQTLLLLRLLTHATGAKEGVIGGQSLEAGFAGSKGANAPFAGRGPERLARYHTMKTATLFAFSTEAGAIAARATPRCAWHDVGIAVGRCYQLVDDLCDVAATEDAIGKPTQRDAALGRPNAALLEGTRRVGERFDELFDWVRNAILSLAKEPIAVLRLLDEIRQLRVDISDMPRGPESDLQLRIKR